MYLHLGNDVSITASSVITIINLEQAVTPEINEIIEIADSEGLLYCVNGIEKQKSLVICEHAYYISPISSMTLLRRSQSRWI